MFYLSFSWKCLNVVLVESGRYTDSPSVSLLDGTGAEGFSGPGASYGGSFRGGLPPSQSHMDQDQGQDPAPGIGFTAGPGSGPEGPPTTTNYNNIHIPPGAHAPANTPAEVLPPAGRKLLDAGQTVWPGPVLVSRYPLIIVSARRSQRSVTLWCRKMSKDRLLDSLRTFTDTVFSHITSSFHKLNYFWGNISEPNSPQTLLSLADDVIGGLKRKS